MRVVIADDHRIVRDGLTWMLSESDHIEIVGEASSGEELIDLLEHTEVDVVLLDVRMPGMSGLEALERIQSGSPQVRIIILSMHDRPAYVRRAIELGASGYLLKNTSRAELLRALETVAEGGSYLQGEVVTPLISTTVEGAQTGLSPREIEVLQLVANGRENKQIAAELGISEATVKTYLRGIFDQFDVASRAEAVAVGLRKGVIE